MFELSDILVKHDITTVQNSIVTIIQNTVFLPEQQAFELAGFVVAGFGLVLLFKVAVGRIILIAVLLHLDLKQTKVSCDIKMHNMYMYDKIFHLTDQPTGSFSSILFTYNMQVLIHYIIVCDL